MNEQELSIFRTDVLDGYEQQCAILGRDGHRRRDGSPDPSFLTAVEIVPNCFLKPLDAREYEHCRWNGILFTMDLATLFEVNKLRIAEDGTIHFADTGSDYGKLYAVKGWTERIVQPPNANDDPKYGDVNREVWRMFLRWRWEKYGEILKVAGGPLRTGVVDGNPVHLVGSQPGSDSSRVREG